MAQGDGPRPSRCSCRIDWEVLSRVAVAQKWSNESTTRTFYVDAHGDVLSVDNAHFLRAIRGRKIMTKLELLKYAQFRAFPKPPQLRGRAK